MDTISNKPNTTKQLKNYIKLRSTIKGQFTRLHKTTNNIKYDEVDERLEKLHNYWCKFEKLQDNIDLLTDDSKSEEVNYRCDMKDMHITLKAELIDLLLNLK